MKSKTSLFNRAIYNKTMLRFWPIWGCAIFFAILIPLGHLVTILNHANNLGVETEIATKVRLYEIAVDSIPLCYFFYVIIVMTAIWSYLYSARSVSLMHSIPVSRKCLYVTNLVSALTMTMVPIVIGDVLYELVDIGFGGGDITAFFVVLLVGLCESILLISIATLAAMITGHAVVLPVLFYIINALATALETVVGSFVSGFLFGYTGSSRDYLLFLSPYFYLSSNLYYTNVDGEVTLYGLKYAVIYGLVGLVILFLSYFLYKVKRNETAGDPIAFNCLKPVCYVLSSGMIAILLGQAFYYILGFDSNYFVKVPMIILCVFAGAVGFYVTRMILSKRLSVFDKKSLPGLIVTLAAVLLICILASVDVFRVEKYLPETSEIETANISFDNSKIMVTDPQQIECIKALHESFISDKDLITDSYNNSAYYICTISYELKNGSIITRNYPFIISDGSYKDCDSSRTLMGIMENRELLLATMNNLTQARKLSYMSIYGNVNGGYLSGNGTSETYIMNELYQALYEDISAGNYTYALVDYDESDYFYLDVEATDYDIWNNSNIQYTKFAVAPTMVNTRAVLDKYGWLEFMKEDYIGLDLVDYVY